MNFKMAIKKKCEKYHQTTDMPEFNPVDAHIGQ